MSSGRWVNNRGRQRVGQKAAKFIPFIARKAAQRGFNRQPRRSLARLQSCLTRWRPLQERARLAFHDPARFATPHTPEALVMLQANQPTLWAYAGELFMPD